MFDSLPKDATGILDWSWADFEPYFADLADRTLTAQNVQGYLTDWTRIGELAGEVGSRLSLASDQNTADEEAKRRHERFLEEIYPSVEEALQKLKQRLLALGAVPAGFELPMKKMKTEADLFREDNLPLLTQEEKLGKQYDAVVGSQTVIWEGKEVTVAQLRPVFQLPDRNLREKAWRVGAVRQLEDQESINDVWKQLLELRLKVAANAGYRDYRSFRWKDLLRFDYTPDDCRSFHRAIEEVMVPAAKKLCEDRRRNLGVTSLRPWDMDVDPLNRPPLVPYKNVLELKNTVSSIFHSLDSPLGAYFDIMTTENLLDLENRKNKTPGGYCTDFPAAKRPFILMNAVGVHDDVQTLLHESGHAFHKFESDYLPYYQQRSVGMEFAEVASMAMELLASPYLIREKGGFYSPLDGARALTEQLEKSILFWPYMAVVDSFQHWVYENPEEAVHPLKCNARWTELSNRFLPWTDWTGLQAELATGWQRKLHIHRVPFYYVEYGIAQLGAVQIWADSLQNEAAALEAYRKALALGATVSIPDLFSAAGAKFALDASTLKSAAELMTKTINSLVSA